MRHFFQKPFVGALVYGTLLVLFTAYVLLDAFVIPRAGVPAVADTAALASAVTQSSSAQQSTSASEATVTDTSYDDGSIQISIETLRLDDTTYYVADIQLASADSLKTAFAQATYGRNIKATTSEIAAENNAIFAINGDFYGFRDTGYVIRGGQLYRDTASSTAQAEDLVIDSDGNFSIINESEVTAQQLLEQGAVQVFSFGPALVEDGQVVVSTGEEVDQAMTSNPRTAIGQISALHYLVIVSDGRTSESAGLTLYQLATLFAQRGCTVAYNLDGGGSSTMVFNGNVVNNPTSGGSIAERAVSDIVYIA